MKTLKDSNEILILCSVVFVLQFAWVLGTDNPTPHKMYPFSDQLISVQAYMDYFFRNTSYLIMMYLLAKFIPGMSDRLGIFFWLWLGYMIEYLLCYNEPFAYFGPIPISYSLFAGIIMIAITLNEIIKDDTHRSTNSNA